jgi:ATP-dependent DNA helicase DinG
MMHVNVARKNDGAGILPDHAVLVVDEAHTLETVASEHLGEKVTDGQIQKLLNRVYHERFGSGLLRRVKDKMSSDWFDEAVSQVNRTRDAAYALFGGAEAFLDGRTIVRFRDPPHPEEWLDTLVEGLKKLSGILTRASAVYQEKERLASLARDKALEKEHAVSRMAIEAVVKRGWDMCQGCFIFRLALTGLPAIPPDCTRSAASRRPRSCAPVA